MAEEIGARFRRLRWLVTKIETYHTQVDEMMLLQVKDGLGAMRYGQFGGSFPDPTARTVIAPEGAKNVWARDNRAETDRNEQWADLAEVERILERMDIRRQNYMSANNNIRDRLDPTDWCRIHFHLQLYEGFRRRAAGGDLCTTCYGFMYGTGDIGGAGREPTPTEADFHHRHGRWPHKLIDPRERRAI